MTQNQQAHFWTPSKIQFVEANIGITVALIIILSFFCPVEAQQTTKDIARIGFISTTGTAENPSPWLGVFRLRLNDLGYVVGKNISIETRHAEGRLDRMPMLVSELVQQKVDVIVAPNNVVIRAAREATKTIPIIMITTVDPVDAGYVNSFANPGANITGLANLSRDLSAKRLELLRDVLPQMSRVAILWDADGPGPKVAFKEYKAAAQAFKLELRSFEVHGPDPDFAGAFHAARSTRVDALIVVGNALIYQHAKQIFELAIKNRLPSMTEEGRFVSAGGLLSYGASLADLYRRAAEYVVEILKGANPGNLPVKLPSKFEVFINLKTADKIGVVIPQSLLLQADKVIQ